MEVCNLLFSSRIPTIRLQPQRLLIVTPIHALGGRSEFYSRSGGGGLYTPLQVKSPAGKYLSTLLHNEEHEFKAAVENQLLRLSDDHERTTLLMNSIDTDHDEAMLCKSITDGVKKEIKEEVEEVIYMLICRRFFESGVHMLPRISDCIVKSRLELSTSKNCQLEHVYTPDVLELVSLYITRVTGLEADSSVKDYWKLIQIDHCYLPMMYLFALFHGHFLKSASSRYALELLFDNAYESTYSFKSYALGFPPGLRLIHSVPKSNEATNMTTKHLEALFSRSQTRLASTEGLVTTSLGTLTRLALEGFAFGTFLWDTEYYVNKFYKLQDEDLLTIS